MSMNICLFTGRIGSDPELRNVGSKNTAIVDFSIAVDSGYGENKKTSWLDFTVWGKSAETFAKYCVKGTKVEVEAEAEQQKWQSQDGSNRSKIVFRVKNWGFAESKESKNTSASNASSDDGFMNVPDGIDDELPFA